MQYQIEKYVLGFAFSRDGKEVVLIKKNRPEWQKDKYNGIGGKIEAEDNSPDDAMIREFKEETGVPTFIGGLYGWRHFATMVFKNDVLGGEAIVYCYKLNSNAMYQCKTIEDELIERINLEDLIEKPLMANVQILIHLAKSEFNFTELVSSLNENTF